MVTCPPDPSGRELAMNPERLDKDNLKMLSCEQKLFKFLLVSEYFLIIFQVIT